MNTTSDKNSVMERFTRGMGETIAALKEAQRIIGEELKTRKRDMEARLGGNKALTILSHENRAGKGVLSGRNDREAFLWNGVTVTEGEEKREYLIDLFFNEVDERTGNFHTQLGHLQFAALLPGKDGPHEMTEGGVYRFNENRLKDSGQSLRDYGPNGRKTELRPFDPVKLVSDFIDFVEEWEAGRKQKTA